MSYIEFPQESHDIIFDVSATPSGASTTALGDPIFSVARVGANASLTVSISMGASAGLYFSGGTPPLKQTGQMDASGNIVFYNTSAILTNALETLDPNGASLTFMSSLGDPIYGVAMGGGASVTIDGDADLTLSPYGMGSWTEDDAGKAFVRVGGIGVLKLRPMPDAREFEVIKRVSLIMPDVVTLDDNGRPL